MLLTRLHVRHFRSLYDIEIQLKPLTIIIGPNASGKSNIFKALRFLHDGVAGDRLEWQAYDGQIDHLRWYGIDQFGNRPENLEFACYFGTKTNILSRYRVLLRCSDYLNVTDEQLDITLKPERELQPFFRRSGVLIEKYIGQRGQPLKKPQRTHLQSSRTLTLREEGPDLSLETAQAVYAHLCGWRFFDISLPQARQAAFVPQFPEQVPPLAHDAANLSAFLYALWRLKTDDFNDVADAVANLIELPEKLLVEHDAERGGQNARYFFFEQPFGEAQPVPPHSVSDGTIRLLAYLALLIGDKSVSLACLEEPDRGLHPRLLLYLADILRQAASPVEAEDAPMPQILLTTHSPEFMDCFNLAQEEEYLQVYIAERDELGRTVMKPTTAEEFAPWLEKYRLGEAVRRRLV